MSVGVQDSLLKEQHSPLVPRSLSQLSHHPSIEVITIMILCWKENKNKKQSKHEHTTRKKHKATTEAIDDDARDKTKSCQNVIFGHTTRWEDQDITTKTCEWQTHTYTTQTTGGGGGREKERQSANSVAAEKQLNKRKKNGKGQCSVNSNQSKGRNEFTWVLTCTTAFQVWLVNSLLHTLHCLFWTTNCSPPPAVAGKDNKNTTQGVKKNEVKAYRT